MPKTRRAGTGGVTTFKTDPAVEMLSPGGVIVPKQEVEEEVAEEEVALGDLTVAELRERVDERGLEIPSRATKAEIIEALEAPEDEDDEFPATDSDQG